MAMRLPRMARISASSTFSRSLPSNRTSPASIRPGGDGIKRMTESAVTLLPDPDSPTMATVSPARTSKDTWSTAVRRPRSLLKRVVRLRTCSRGGAMASRLRSRSSVAHLLFQVLVDPDAGVDWAGTYGAGAQFTVIVFHPGPPGREDMGGRQPDVGCLVQDLPR